MTINGQREDVTIFDALERAARENGRRDSGQLRELSRMDMATIAGMRNGRVGYLRHDFEPKSPSLSETVRLAVPLHCSLEEMVDRRAGVFPLERNGLFWRLAGLPRSTRARAARVAAARAVAGEKQEAIREAVEVVYCGANLRPPALDEVALRDLVQAGLDMGLVRFEEAPPGAEEGFENPAMGRELSEALALDAKQHTMAPTQPDVRVHVVRNVSHQSFSQDPVAPFLVARVAHRIVEGHLSQHPTVYNVGLAGGQHCAIFVRTAGAESSPFPDDSGDKKITFVPLTLEPFSSHRLPMADAVVGQMVHQARALLGSRRVDGLTLQSFGFFADEQVSRHGDWVINRVRDGYRDLDVAIFGCGDLESDGWLEQVVRNAKIERAVEPATDLCLNLLAEDGTPIPLSDGREFVGVSLPDIRRLVRSEDRLAVLLTTGRTKGRPIVVAARAGCADTIVCDEAAAAAAIEMLAGV